MGESKRGGGEKLLLPVPLPMTIIPSIVPFRSLLYPPPPAVSTDDDADAKDPPRAAGGDEDGGGDGA